MSNPSGKPAIAIICDTIPYPTRSGDNQRLAELISVLREQGWSVHLVLCGLVERRFRKLCRFHVDALHVYSGTGLRTRLRNGARRSVRLLDRVTKLIQAPPTEEIVSRLLGRSMAPLVVNYWQRYPNGLSDYVALLSETFVWKAVIIEYIWLHHAIDKLGPRVTRLLDTHDIQHRRVEEFASRGMTFPLPITREKESRIFNRFHAAMAIQAVEAQTIRQMCPQLTVLTVGSCGSPLAAGSRSPIEGRVLYVGGYNGANVDGLRTFLDLIWPQVLACHPTAILHVCGYVYRAFPGTRFKNVEFLGHKESLAMEYAEAAVVINPAWIGTGLKIKTIEALAYGKALLTTTKGIEGLPQSVKQATLIADDQHEFAAALIRLLAQTQLRESLSQSAAAYASANLNKAKTYEDLFRFLNHLR